MVSLANHHDNFDNYDSKYHALANLVNVGRALDKDHRHLGAR